MNNSELFVAIEATFDMIKVSSYSSDERKVLLKHLEFLLTEQVKRTKN